MENKEKLELEASRILDKFNVAEVCSQATFDEMLYGTSCIIISKGECRTIQPYSKEWFSIFRKGIKYGNLDEESRKLFNGEFIEGEVNNPFKIEE